MEEKKVAIIVAYPESNVMHGSVKLCLEVTQSQLDEFNSLDEEEKKSFICDNDNTEEIVDSVEILKIGEIESYKIELKGENNGIN